MLSRVIPAAHYCLNMPLRYGRDKYASCRLARRYKYCTHKIKALKDIHRRQRCFIIGTGPSLNRTNLSLLKDEIVFGVNTLYRGLDRFGIACKYYAVSDVEVWKSHFESIMALDTTLLLSSDAAKDYLAKKGFYQKFEKSEPLVINDLGPIWSRGWLIRDLSKGAYWGYTVITDICLQAAYYMGFKEVYLLGCDSDYSGMHRFDGLKTECQGGGAIGDWSKIFESYQICKNVYEGDGREIINSTVGGKLEIFRRKPLEEVVRSS